MAAKLPPGFSRSTSIGDCDEADSHLVEILGPCKTRSGEEDNSLAMDISISVFEFSGFLSWKSEKRAAIDLSLDHYLICAGVEGRVIFENGTDTVKLEGMTGAIIPPFGSGSLSWQAGATLFGVLISESDFRRCAKDVLSGSPSVFLGRLRTFALETYPGSVFLELVEFLRAERRDPQGAALDKPVRLLFDRLIVYGLLRLLKEDRVERESGKSHMLVPKHVKLAEDYIKAHLSEPMDNVMLATIVDVSPRSLHRGFVHFKGVTPARYIQDLRLEAAHQLLVSGRGSRDIRDIAAGIGFNSYAAFWRSYVRRYGGPPSRTHRSRE